MRDPDLVQRAERAAMALERAWGHWRVMHGLGSDPLPPVSSYVGYSLEEPWGQPRVVFGVGAEEAEQLAALLAGHDCYGPVHAEVSARPDWRLAASSGPATAAGRPFDGGVSVPAQAPPPGAEPSAERDGWHMAATAGTEDVDGEPPGVGRYEAAPTAIDSTVARGYRPSQDETEPPGSAASPIPAEPASALPTAAAASPDALDPLPADPHESPWPAGVQDGGDAGQDQPDPGRPYSDRSGAAGRTGSIPPPAEFWQRGEPAGTVELAAVEQSSVVAFRRRPEQPAGQWQEQIPAALPASDSLDAAPSQGPGYYGRRYQGYPPRYQPGPGQQDPPALFGTGTEVAGDRSGAGLLGAVPSGADLPEGKPADAGEPVVMPADADHPEALQSSTEQPAAAAPSAGGSSADGASADGPSADGPSADRSSASGSSAGRPKAGQAGVRKSTSGQSTAGSTTARSKSGQSRTGQSRTVQSGGPPKAGQPRTAQSKAGQPRQSSPASSAGRGSGREAGKRPRD